MGSTPRLATWRVRKFSPPPGQTPRLILPRQQPAPAPAPAPTPLLSSTMCFFSTLPHRHHFSVLSHPPPKYPQHVPLTLVERSALLVSSALTALANPRRADLIAVLGDLTATPFAAARLRDVMLSDATGRRILRDRPRLSSRTLPVDDMLERLPSGSLGREYAAWARREHISADTRAPVRYLDDWSSSGGGGGGGGAAAGFGAHNLAGDIGANAGRLTAQGYDKKAEELAYVVQRYRESHDFYHVLVGLPTVREGEVALKLFEYCNTRLPMTGMAVASALGMKPVERARFWETFGPWAIRAGTRASELICVYWEEELETDLSELRRRLNVLAPPDMRAMRKADRERQRQRDMQKAARPW